MNQKRTFFTVLVLMALIGILTAVLRHTISGTPFFPGQSTSVWLVEARVDFEATGGPVTASLSLPGLKHLVLRCMRSRLLRPAMAFPSWRKTTIGEPSGRNARPLVSSRFTTVPIWSSRIRTIPVMSANQLEKVAMSPGKQRRNLPRKRYWIAREKRPVHPRA